MADDFVLKDVPENRLYIPEDRVLEYWQLLDESSEGYKAVPRYKLFVFLRDLFPDVDFEATPYVQRSAAQSLGNTKPYLLKEEYTKRTEG
jgi:hypothetical protein